MPKLEADAEPLDQRRLGGQRIAELAVRRDREPDEAADLAARVVDRDLVSQQRELSRARKACGARAEDGDPPTTRARRRGKAGAARKGDLRRVALQPSDRDRLATFMRENARALAEGLNRADARAGPAEQVVRDDPAALGVR